MTPRRKRSREAFPRRPWCRKDDRILRKLYPDAPTAAVAHRLGRTLAATYSHAQKLGLEKSAAYLASPAACRLRRENHPGKAFQFRKGHLPANKGLRRPGWAPGRMKETQFRKGQRGWNWRPVGSERVINGYRYTKISDHRRVPWTRNWRPTHVLLWEQQRGPVPPKHAVAFVNGDRGDVRLDNLTLIARREPMARNTVHNLPKPLAETVQLLGALKRKINRRARIDEEQDRRSA